MHWSFVYASNITSFCSHFTYIETLWKLWNEAWIYPMEMFQTHLLFMTIYGSLNIRWRPCTPMCHWLRDITLSSNDVFSHRRPLKNPWKKAEFTERPAGCTWNWMLGLMLVYTLYCSFVLLCFAVSDSGKIFSLLPSANQVCEGYVFTRVCHSVHRGSV